MCAVVSILVTFTALVLSLLLSEVKGTFDTFDARLRAFAGDLSNLDIHLREYGADAEPIRATLRNMWRRRSPTAGETSRRRRAIFRDLRRERPSSASSSAPFSFRSTPQFTNWTRPTISDNGSRRFAIQSDRRSVARPASTARDFARHDLLAADAAVRWLAVVFGVFGLLSPRNAVVYLSIVTCAICVASAVFLIDDFDSAARRRPARAGDSMRATLSASTRHEELNKSFAVQGAILKLSSTPARPLQALTPVFWRCEGCNRAPQERGNVASTDQSPTP